jgi:hypothetical protein
MIDRDQNQIEVGTMDAESIGWGLWRVYVVDRDGYILREIVVEADSRAEARQIARRLK